MLPLVLTGYANLWFNSTPSLPGKTFDFIAKELVNQFHNDSDVWLLRQQLCNRKQLNTETVSRFAEDIRRLSQRINLPREEIVNYFIQGLKPAIKHYVLLQRPASLEDAETQAKLKESTPDPQSVDRTDEIITSFNNTLAQLKISEQNKQPTVAAYSRPYTDNSQNKNYQRDQLVPREEVEDLVAQRVRQEMHRVHNQQTNGPDYRNRRSFDGRPICNYCRKAGHIAYTCRKRQADSRDPRIPFQSRSREPNPRAREDRRVLSPSGQPQSN